MEASAAVAAAEAPSSDKIKTTVESMARSLERLPAVAVAPLVDCILASADLSPSSLFTPLLDVLAASLQDTEWVIGSSSLRILPLVTALCHLLKNPETQLDALSAFLWKGFLPLLQKLGRDDKEVLNRIVDSVCEVVIETDSWEVVDISVIPFYLRLAGLAIGMLPNEKYAAYKWVKVPSSQDLYSEQHFYDFHGITLPMSGSLPISITCHILTSILLAAMKRCQIPTEGQQMFATLDSLENIVKKMLWDLSHMILHMFGQSSECRSWAIRFLFPSILWAFGSVITFEISANGEKCSFSRVYFLRRIWDQCIALYSLGPLERRDVFNVLSLCAPLFSVNKDDRSTYQGDFMEEFDVRKEESLWKMIRKGLVDKEALMRKQSLQVLKSLVGQQSKESQIELVVSSSTKSDQAKSGTTKRGKWAEKEAKSLGVGKKLESSSSNLNACQRWEAFFLLYEMLDEFGSHLVEAAWTHQISLLLCLPSPQSMHANHPATQRVYDSQMGTLSGTFSWLAVLWERGFVHENPQVRCLIMQSFLCIDWKIHEAELVPESFVLGPLMQGLNDPIHHKDFGFKGVFSSKTIEHASKFIYNFCQGFNKGKLVSFLSNLASSVNHEAFGRVGLMAFSVCIASASEEPLLGRGVEVSPDILGLCSMSSGGSNLQGVLVLVDTLRIVIEKSKHHFNPKYRLRVCDQVLKAVTAIASASDLPIELLLHFVAALPREFSDFGGNLREKLQHWLANSKSASGELEILKNIYHFAENFIKKNCPTGTSICYDDEDLDVWNSEANRWARLLFLLVTDECNLEPLFRLIRNCGLDLCIEDCNKDWIPVKFFLLITNMVQVIHILSDRSFSYSDQFREEVNVVTCRQQDILNSTSCLSLIEKFTELFILILEDLISWAKSSCLVFWSDPVQGNELLPNSLRGKLGGPSQRRLPYSVATAVLQSIFCMKSVACLLSWCGHFKNGPWMASVLDYLLSFCWNVITAPAHVTETGAETCLAAYEALVPVLNTICCSFSPLAHKIVASYNKSILLEDDGGSFLDPFVNQFFKNVNSLLALGVLAQSRKAILMDWKWLCLDSLLSIPYNVKESEVRVEGTFSFFSKSVLENVLAELVESLEVAGESSVLPMLRSIRSVILLLSSQTMGAAATTLESISAELMWQLVRSAWILHVNCNKRRIAPIAGLLSAVLHTSLFDDMRMHVEADGQPGPMKWFIEMILDEGTKSPRTIRLAALHLTGLWLLHPKVIKYYIKELKLLSLHGSVAFDEDFEAELTENHEVKMEVMLLVQIPETDLSEAYINTEMYARVAVAVMCSKLADLADKLQFLKHDIDSLSAQHSGKLFLLELLNSAVNDKDLSKELYKKYSAIHRRKVRAWQMICVLVRFVDEDIVHEVTEILHICLHRNNLPAVRQYLEVFAIQVYLKFPKLVGIQLIPTFHDYNMRPQALSSYVFIAANVILHSADKSIQLRHLYELLPPMIPFLTSHHHSLRGFTQLLVYQVLSKLVEVIDPSVSEHATLERKCFMDLKCYLTDNPDCKRLRASMHGILDQFDPITSATPSGIFSARNEDVDFECAPTSLMEHVVNFLNDVREDLRESMGRDEITIQNENLAARETVRDKTPLIEVDESITDYHLNEVSVDFQKKITLHKHETQESDPIHLVECRNIYGSLLDSFMRMAEMEKEDLLLTSLVYNRSGTLERLNDSRQPFILVASLLERIPNLAGLARTCEVFRAASLALADASIVQDKQFQLISVTAEKWVPIIEVPVASMKLFLEEKKRAGFSILGLEQTANSIPLDAYSFPTKTVLVLGREKEGIPVDIIHILDACIEIPQLGVVRSLNVHVSGAIALWEYTRQQRSSRQ